MKARDVKPGDRIGDREVRWVMCPLRPGIEHLKDILPDGGALITFTNSTQIGLAADAEVVEHSRAEPAV